MKKQLNSVLIMSLIIINTTGCDLIRDLSDLNEYNDYKDTADTTITNVHVNLGGNVINAMVVDVNDKPADYIGGDTYQFKGHIRYPIRAYGGYIDVNDDGVIDGNDITNQMLLRTNKYNNLTLMTTYLSAEPDIQKSDPRMENKTENEMLIFTGLSNVNDLYLLPKDNVYISAFSHSIFKKAQNNMVKIGTTELNNIETTDFQTDYNNKLNNYLMEFSNGETIYNINKNNFINMFLNSELKTNMTYIFYPSGTVDLNNKDLSLQTPIYIRGVNSNGIEIVDQKVVNDSFASIDLFLEAYGRIKVQIDVLNEAINKYGYSKYITARDDNVAALSYIDNILQYYKVFTAYPNKNYTYPSLSNGYNDSDLLNWYNTNINSLNNDNDQDFTIVVARYEWEKSLPFFKFLFMRYLPDLQYKFNDVYNKLIDSRNNLVELADSL